MITTLEIGTVIVPTQALLEFDQDYEDLVGESFRRTADGSGVLRSAGWQKLKTVISGKGWVPSAFENLATGLTAVLKCAMPRSVSGATPSITLPAARRSDTGHTPIGFALVGDVLIETDISSVVSDVATLVAVTGATGYRVHVWPQITAVILKNTCKGASDANYTWQIEAEEV